VSISSAELRTVVEQFVAAAAQPALLDPSEEPLHLIPEQWSIGEWNNRLVLQAWNSERNLVRKVLGVKKQTRGRLCLISERFPKLEAELQIVDLAAPLGVELERRGTRVAFRERLRLILLREFPDWRIGELTTEINLEHSLPPTFVRGFLRRGKTGMAVVAAGPDTADCGSLAAIGLIWLDYLRARERTLVIDRLVLFAPSGRTPEVASRAAMIDPVSARCEVFSFDEKDRAAALDFADGGNLESTLPPCRRPLMPNLLPPEVPVPYGVDSVAQSDGSVSYRVKGLEFARWTMGKLFCGVASAGARRRRCGVESVVALAEEIARIRAEDYPDAQHPIYAQYPEGWLESQVRAHPQVIDASLMPAPIYGQVPVFGAPDRGIIDLLAVDHTGRLAVIEIKATANLQLPFQALDYWQRVRKHLLAGDFERHGYFPGVPLRREAPKILLVAPALEFHSTSESIIGHLSPEIDITRVGVAADWRKELRVMFRLRGAEHPR
jgi:hypothetical protein